MIKLLASLPLLMTMKKIPAKYAINQMKHQMVMMKKLMKKKRLKQLMVLTLTGSGPKLAR